MNDRAFEHGWCYEFITLDVTGYFSFCLRRQKGAEKGRSGCVLNLRRSIQILARETPAPLRQWVKRALVPAFVLRYIYPPPPPKKRGADRRKRRTPATEPNQPFNFATRAVRRPDGLEITFQSISPPEFSEDAFVKRTLTRVGGRGTRRFFPLDPAPVSATPERAPAGIVFHVRHCGSTLVCELLKCIRGVTIYSEPTILHDVLAPPGEWTREQTIEGLRLVGRLFAAHAGGRYFIKLFSPDTLFCDLILQAFPETPWIFCVRDPLEVAASDLTKPFHLMSFFGNPNNPYLPYLLEGGDADISREAYVACAYAAYCRAIAKADWKWGKIINYEDLPPAVCSVIAPHFGLAVDVLEGEAMARRALTDAKARRGQVIPFRPDTESKRNSASEELKVAVDRYARPALADLLALRQEQS